MSKNPSDPTATLEALTGVFTVPVSVAARIVGISLVSAKKTFPIIDRGYRSKEVSIQSIREYIANRTNKTVTPA